MSDYQSFLSDAGPPNRIPICGVCNQRHRGKTPFCNEENADPQCSFCGQRHRVATAYCAHEAPGGPTP